MRAISVLASQIKREGQTSPSFHLSALVEGLRAAGLEVVETDVYGQVTTKHVCCWGWKRAALLRERGREVMVMERGYIADRFTYSSLGWNGLNNYADFPLYPDDAGTRFKESGGVMRPWKKGGDYVLILGQVKGDASLKGQNILPWYSSTAASIKKHWGLPVYFRPHPDSVRRGGYRGVDGLGNLDCDLQSAISGALFTVAYNSNSCLDSILAGVPCYAGDKGTMAYDLCMPDIKTLVYPSREAVINRIAHTQWTPDEIRTGAPIKKLVEHIQ